MSSAIYRHPGDGMFSVVLTDEDDEDDSSSDDDTTVFSRKQVEWNKQNEPSTYVTDTLAAGNQKPSSDDVINHKVKSNENSTFSEKSFNKYTRRSSITRPVSLQYSSSVSTINAVAAIAVLFLSASSLPIQFPDGVLPTSREESNVQGFHSAHELQLQAVITSALIGAILCAIWMDHVEVSAQSDSVSGQQQVTKRKILLASSSGVVILAFFRCIPDVPLFVMVIAALIAGGGLTAVSLLITSVVKQFANQVLHDNDETVYGFQTFANQSVATSSYLRCTLFGCIVAALSGAPLVSSGLSLILLTTSTSTDVDTSSVLSTSASSDLSFVNKTHNFITSANDIEIFNISNFSFTTHSSGIAIESSTIANFSTSDPITSSSTNRSSTTSHQLADAACLLVCSLGALAFVLFIISSLFRAADATTTGTRSAIRRSLLRDPATDDAEDDASQTETWRSSIRSQLRNYTHREVTLLTLVYFFVGSQQMFAYFVFVRTYEDNSNESQAAFKSGICMATVSMLISVPVGLLVDYFGRMKCLLPTAIVIPTILVIVLFKESSSYGTAAYFAILCIWAACDSCLQIALTMFADQLGNTHLRNRTFEGGLSAGQSVGRLTVFLLFSCSNTNGEHVDHSDWSPLQVSTTFVLVIYVIAFLSYLAAEISLRLRNACKGPPLRETHISVSKRTSSPPSNTAYVRKYPTVGPPLPSWLPHIDPVNSSEHRKIAPLSEGIVEHLK